MNHLALVPALPAATAYLWLIPLFPLLGAAVNGLAGRWLPKALVAGLACLTILLSFLLAVTAFQQVAGGAALHQTWLEWIQVGRVHAELGLTVDRLSAVMLLVVTGVGFLIHLYSVGYMEDDPGFARYFAYLNLFAAAMLVLVLADNLVALFIGWEGVGLCSYLLIGFWFTDDAKAYAGRKAFVVNRIGDFGVLIGTFVLLKATGHVDFAGMQAASRMLTPAIATTAGLLLFMGACGKSAQLPLYVWLPDAMAGPTPVSALIHAATMVTAGVYLVARMGFLYDLAPVALAVVAIVGTLTALWAALIATAQHDIKKVLAYSTVSQLGFMFIGNGVGAYDAGLGHVVTHAFFKACLFLGAGSVIHGLGGEQDMRKMGGLGKEMPHTSRTFLIATIAITGIFPLSGFFSKDEILHRALTTTRFAGIGLGWLGPAVYAIGTLTALLTSYYMWRLYQRTFNGARRNEHHAHESPAVMTGPLWILATLSIVGALLVMPRVQWLERWLHPHADLEGEIPYVPFLVALAVAWAGYYLAQYFHGAGSEARASKVAAAWPRLTLALENKLYVDEAYDLVIVRPLRFVAHTLWEFGDALLIDGMMVNGTARLTGWIAGGLRKLQNGDAQAYATVIALGTAALLFAMLR